MNLSVKIGNTTFKNPVTVASGTFGHAEKYFQLEEVKKLGAITPKTVTLACAGRQSSGSYCGNTVGDAQRDWD